MRRLRRLALGASSLALVVSAAGGGSVLAQDSAPVRIGSVDFYESRLMAEIYAQALEGAGFNVERLGGLGTRNELAPAFEAGQVDLRPEYVGSGLRHYTNAADDPTVAELEVTGDGETNRVNLQTAFDALGIGATVLAITPGEDTNAIVVRQDTAEEFALDSVGDLAAVQQQLRWGLPPECDTNALCSGALVEYGISYPPAQREALAACDAPMAEALAGNAIDVAQLCSTQPPIAQYGFVVLEDDLDTQPADNLAPVIRNDYLDQVEGGADAIAAILDPVSARITTEVLLDLGVKVAVDQQDIADVAAEFLAGGATDGAAASPAGDAAASPAAEPAASPSA
jgi:osmoprotectant transport system substrate-binding protein